MRKPRTPADTWQPRTFGDTWPCYYCAATFATERRVVFHEVKTHAQGMHRAVKVQGHSLAAVLDSIETMARACA